ncbi:RidA family protein [Peptoniphilus sp. KCTC 25270]|uniref:RidA family protein n=1 Tax=Peptoniphilus sp. KCTC 25270 TaxID=2897414 RepID=UPI002104A069|nr:RidA family protein [Peptoniphilus sp. KCTC 25270]
MNTIHTNNAPAAIGPYSQGMVVGDLVFTSGQIPADPATGELKTEIKEATKQSLENVKAILQESGSSLDKVIKVSIFITNMDDFSSVNEVYSEYFSEHKPARSCVAVKTLPKNSIIEIEAIASK